MAIKPTEARTLWARSGNRCAICRIELTPEGGTSTLGQMCHIVGRSDDGPRGLDSLTGSDKDSYDNLILLCRNDHGLIDDEVSQWPVSKLLETKTKHERWVAAQLSTSSITVLENDNREFLKSREKKWLGMMREQPPILAITLTPLKISEDVLDATSDSVMRALNSANVSDYENPRELNRNLSKLSPDGVRNETLSLNEEGQKHSIEVHRVGHFEYVICFMDKQSVIRPPVTNAGEPEAEFSIRYTSLATSVSLGVDWIVSAWSDLLPFNDMHYECRLLNIKNTNLYSNELRYGRYLVGTLMDENIVGRSRILTEQNDANEIKLDTLGRLANCYGMYLDQLLDEKGEFVRPRNRP